MAALCLNKDLHGIGRKQPLLSNYIFKTIIVPSSEGRKEKSIAPDISEILKTGSGASLSLLKCRRSLYRISMFPSEIWVSVTRTTPCRKAQHAKLWIVQRSADGQDTNTMVRLLTSRRHTVVIKQNSGSIAVLFVNHNNVIIWSRQSFVTRHLFFLDGLSPHPHESLS